MSVQVLWKNRTKNRNIIIFAELVKHVTRKFYHYEIILWHWAKLWISFWDHRWADIYFIKYGGTNIADELYFVAGIFEKRINK